MDLKKEFIEKVSVIKVKEGEKVIIHIDMDGMTVPFAKKYIKLLGDEASEFFGVPVMIAPRNIQAEVVPIELEDLKNDKDFFKNMVKEGKWFVKFTKKDGSERPMNFTIDFAIIPEEFHPKPKLDDN